jgi:hypothetical protein
MAGDETPRRERPAPEYQHAPETAGSSPFLQGVRAALTILAGIVALEGLAALGNWLTGGTQSMMFVLLGLLIAGGGIAVLILAGMRLPRRARLPFWAIGVICVAIAFVLWGITCGMMVT